MNIGIDIDNVLSNFNEELLKEFMKHDKELRNSGIINKDVYITRGVFDWSKDEFDDFYYKNIERIAQNLKVIDGAPEYIKKLREKGYKIYIISGRDNGEYSNPFEMTKEWLDKYNIYYDMLIFTNAYDKVAKARACLENNIDIMIEDSPKNIQEISSKIPVLCFDNPYNKNMEGKNITRIYSWYDVLSKI